MYGNGHAVMEFRQCLIWSLNGFIEVILDGEVVGVTTEMKKPTPITNSTSFPYQNGSKLEIREINVAIMELTKFAITSCGRYFLCIKFRLPTEPI